MNNGNSYQDKYLKLTDNINFSKILNWKLIGISNLTPIGNNTNRFKGTFDGQGYKISNLTITGENDYRGLFGFIEGGTIQNVTLTNANISGKDYVGGIAGHTTGKIENCSVDGTISGGSNVGAIVGSNNNGTYSGNEYVSNAYDDTGAKSWRTLDLPEGVTAKYVSGDTRTIGDKTYYKPGAIFKLTLSITSNDDFAYITGIKGATKNADGTFTYTIGNAFEFEGYAKIGSLGFDSATKTYTIADENALQALADYVNAGNTCQGLKFKLTDNINLSEIENWTPIGNFDNPFRGTFDGKGYKISNLTITGNKNYQGLFGYVEGGTIQNVTLTNANISGSYYVGGIAGDNYGTIGNCSVDGNISGINYVGGIVGYNSGKVQDSFSATTISGSWNVGAIVGYNNNGTYSDNEYASNANDDTGAKKWIKLDLPEGVTVTNANAADKVTVDGIDYYKPNATVKLTLSITSNDDWHIITGIKGATKNADGTFTYTIGNSFEFEGYAKIGSLSFDSATKTYTIADKNDLQALADYVNSGHNCAGYKFNLGNNIDGVDFHIGTSSNMFAGTFNGNDKKITVAYTATDAENNYTDGGALFNYVDGANISNLTVDGTINTSSKFAAGLISHSYGNTTIDNCTSSVTINSTVSGEGIHGGFVGVVEEGKLTVSNSKFDGSFIGTSTSHWGGFVGYNNSNLEISNSLFAPAQVDVNTNQSASFACNSSSNNITSSYCTTTLGTLQGEKVFTELQTPEGVTATFVSGDKITIGDKTYYKPGAIFKLTVEDDYGSDLPKYAA